MARGLVKFFDLGRGWGFITPIGSEGVPANDIFVHARDVERKAGEFRLRLVEGELVEFRVGQDRSGRRCAIGVKRLPAQVLRTQERSDLPEADGAPGGPGRPVAGEG